MLEKVSRIAPCWKEYLHDRSTDEGVSLETINY